MYFVIPIYGTLFIGDLAVSFYLLTFRFTGHRVIQIVVVVAVVGGNIFYTWALGEPTYGLVKNKA